MKWKKAKVIEVIKGIDNHVRGIQLKVFQLSLNQTITIHRPLKFAVPFEINKIEGNETVTRTKRMAAINADARRKVISENLWLWHQVWQGECQKCYLYWVLWRQFVMKRRKLIGWVFFIIFWARSLSVERKIFFSESTINWLPYLIITTFLICSSSKWKKWNKKLRRWLTKSVKQFWLFHSSTKNHNWISEDCKRY